MSFVSIALICMLSCGETTDSEIAKPIEKKETASFQMINISEAEARQLSETFNEFLTYQTEAKYMAAMDYYPPELFESDEQKQSSVDYLYEFRERGMIQRFDSAQLQWAAPWMESEGKQVTFVSFFVEHTIKLEKELKDKAKAYETNVRDKYGKNNYTFDASTNTYEVAGPVKLFIVRFPDDERMYIVNEEYVMVSRPDPMIIMKVVEAMKQFENEARKRL